MSLEATIASPVVSGTSTNASTTNTSSTTTAGIADNFQTFLTLLTTQLQNQNPLDPLDTNQFTQQLVQFAGVEQQLRQNDQLKTLIAIEKSSQSTQALAYVGNTVAVDGSKAQFDGTGATWNINAPAESNVSITITSATGQTAFSGSYSVSQGNSSFGWDGKGNDGTQWPKGSYTMTAVGKDSSGKDVAIKTEVQGVVDSVDLTASPPLLSINGQTYTVSQIKSITS